MIAADKPFDVFISHSTQDAHAASAIKQHLRASGLRCWKAPDDIHPGESWPSAITRALSICRVMVLVWSRNSLASKEVAKELTLAMRNGLTVIPFRIEDVEPTAEWDYHLANTHWMDAFPGDLASYVEELAARIRALLDSENAPAVVSPGKPVPKSQTTSKGSRLAVAAAVIIAAGAFSGALWFFSNRAPEPVAMDAAPEAVTATTAEMEALRERAEQAEKEKAEALRDAAEKEKESLRQAAQRAEAEKQVALQRAIQAEQAAEAAQIEKSAQTHAFSGEDPAPYSVAAETGGGGSVDLSEVKSFWNHNGSVMGLIPVGNSRKFVYVKPRDGLQGLVSPGEVLFEGSSDGNLYTGTARRFREGLPPNVYSVSGQIESGGRRVVMTGVVGTRVADGSTDKTVSDKLVFDLLDENLSSLHATPAQIASGIWLFPDSDRRMLAPQEIAVLSSDELWRARNEIYARRGYIFQSDRGKKYARSLGSAYRPIYADENAVLSAMNGIERSNIERISSFERSLGR